MAGTGSALWSGTTRVQTVYDAALLLLYHKGNIVDQRINNIVEVEPFVTVARASPMRCISAHASWSNHQGINQTSCTLWVLRPSVIKRHEAGTKHSWCALRPCVIKRHEAGNKHSWWALRKSVMNHHDAGTEHSWRALQKFQVSRTITRSRGSRETLMVGTPKHQVSRTVTKQAPNDT